MRDRRGMTLVETILAIGILVLVVTSALAVLLTGEKSNLQFLRWGDNSQQLRLALKQMSDDFAYATWNDGNQVSGNVTEFWANGYVTIPNRDWTGPADWPGVAFDWPSVTIRYTLSGSTLARDVVDQYTNVVTHQVLATGLIPTSDPSGNGSFMKLDPLGRTLSVRLTSRASGVTRLGEAYSTFYLPLESP